MNFKMFTRSVFDYIIIGICLVFIVFVMVNFDHRMALYEDCMAQNEIELLGIDFYCVPAIETEHLVIPQGVIPNDPGYSA